MSAQQHMEQSKVMIGDKCAEIYTYESPDLVYAMNWSVRLSLLSDVAPCLHGPDDRYTWGCRTDGIRSLG